MPDHDLLNRLMRRVTAEDRGFETVCWIWHGEKDKYGYGRIKRTGRRIPAHWVLKGDPPAGLEVDHLCYQRDCVRPAHLEYVTRAENMRRQREHLND